MTETLEVETRSQQHFKHTAKVEEELAVPKRRNCCYLCFCCCGGLYWFVLVWFPLFALPFCVVATILYGQDKKELLKEYVESGVLVEGKICRRSVYHPNNDSGPTGEEVIFVEVEYFIDGIRYVTRKYILARYNPRHREEGEVGVEGSPVTIVVLPNYPDSGRPWDKIKVVSQQKAILTRLVEDPIDEVEVKMGDSQNWAVLIGWCLFFMAIEGGLFYAMTLIPYLGLRLTVMVVVPICHLYGIYCYVKFREEVKANSRSYSYKAFSSRRLKWPLGLAPFGPFMRVVDESTKPSIPLSEWGN